MGTTTGSGARRPPGKGENQNRAANQSVRPCLREDLGKARAPLSSRWASFFHWRVGGHPGPLSAKNEMVEKSAWRRPWALKSRRLQGKGSDLAEMSRAVRSP